MFAIPGIVLLLVQGYLRPQEFFVQLQSVPFLYLFFALALFGLAVDLKLRHTQLVASPLFGWVLAFVGWALFTLALRLPSGLQPAATELAIPFTYFFLLSQGVQSFRALAVVAATILVIGLCLAAVGVHQGTAPFGCFKLNPEARDASGVWDGRSCANDQECQAGDVEPDADYLCERVGLFGTSTVASGRVRYRGALNDPNELALTLGVGLPFAFAFFERKRSGGRLLLLALTLGLIGGCVFLTRSRGGQLVFLTVLAVYFVKRYGARGLVICAVFAAPLLLLGGSRSDADASANERIEMLHMALDLLRWYPGRGVGYGQILEYNPLTAHNSYALTGAELGFPGLMLFTALLYLSFKILATILRRYADDRDAAVARAWAVALLASLAGMSIGVFFLSFCYHVVFWIYIGLVGALYQATRAHDPTLEVRLDGTDLVRLAVIDVVLVVVMFVYTTIKLAS
ncbi:MAG TPA: O-antigen ligase family protein [Polyangia bacterium]